MAIERKLRLSLVAAVVAAALPCSAMDQIQLKSGTKVSGTILAMNKDRVVLRIGDGTAIYSKKAIRRIYDDIVQKEPLTRVLASDELAPWWVALSDLYSSDWVNSIEQVRATEIDAGDLQRVPYLSFRANGVYEMNVYGDPDAPAGLEIGFRGGSIHSGEAQKRCRQFMVSYLIGLEQLRTLYKLDARGGEAEAGGLVIRITPPSSPEAYGGWWVTISDPELLARARVATDEEWEARNLRSVAEMKRFTENETSWRKYSFTDALKRYVPMEKVNER